MTLSARSRCNSEKDFGLAPEDFDQISATAKAQYGGDGFLHQSLPFA
jgi:hypothetical protein